MCIEILRYNHVVDDLDEFADDYDDDWDDELDPAIFDDPVLMVKWLEKQQKRPAASPEEVITQATKIGSDPVDTDKLGVERREVERREKERVEVRVIAYLNLLLINRDVSKVLIIQ